MVKLPLVGRPYKKLAKSPPTGAAAEVLFGPVVQPLVLKLKMPALEAVAGELMDWPRLFRVWRNARKPIPKCSVCAPTILAAFNAKSCVSLVCVARLYWSARAAKLVVTIAGRRIPFGFTCLIWLM